MKIMGICEEIAAIVCFTILIIGAPAGLIDGNDSIALGALGWALLANAKVDLR